MSETKQITSDDFSDAALARSRELHQEGKPDLASNLTYTAGLLVGNFELVTDGALETVRSHLEKGGMGDGHIGELEQELGDLLTGLRNPAATPA